MSCVPLFQILPGIQNEDPEVRNMAMRALGLCCYLSKDLLVSYIPLFMQVSCPQYFNPYPANIFCPENVVCCIYSSALQTTFDHKSKLYELLKEQSDLGPYCL